MPSAAWGAASVSLTAQMRLDAGHQFARAERLGDVVVAADFKAENAIDLIGSRRQKNDRRAREFGGLADLPAKIEPILPGQHHVQHDEIGLPALQFLQRIARAVQQIDT